MGEVQGQVLVADLNADGKMEIFAGVYIAGTYNISRQGWARHALVGGPSAVLCAGLQPCRGAVSVGVQQGSWQRSRAVVACCDAEAVLWPGVCVHSLHSGDTLGNVALLDIHGKEIWEKHFKSMLGQVRACGCWRLRQPHHHNGSIAC